MLGITASGRHRLPLRQCPGAGAECGLLTLAGAGAGAGLGATTAIDHTNIPRVVELRAPWAGTLAPIHRKRGGGD